MRTAMAAEKPRQPSDQVLALADERVRKILRCRAIKAQLRELRAELEQLEASIGPDPLEQQGRAWP